MTEQLTLFDLQQVTSAPVPVYVPDLYWDLIDTPQTQNPDTCVGEQVLDDTAPQHDKKCSPTHWIETYWVQRGEKKYYYFRYMWMEGRKIRRRYIGSTSSKKAIAIMEKVRDAIALGKSPQEIVELIFKKKPTTR